MKVGIIGVGMIGQYHIHNFIKDKRVEIAAICSRTEETLNKVKEKFDIKYGTTNYRDILNNNSIDAVVIATPPFNHAELLLETLHARKHVLIEKPMVVNEKELQMVGQEYYKHSDLVFLDCSCRHSRLQPKFELVKGFIESEKLGDIYFIHHNSVASQFRYGAEYHPEARWALDRKIAGGGVILDWGVYDLSFHLGILGDKPVLNNVLGFQKHIPDSNLPDDLIYDVEHHGACLMEYDTGLRYYYERGTRAYNETGEQTRIYGTRGGLRFAYRTWDSNKIEYFHEGEGDDGRPVIEEIEVDMSGHVDDGFSLIKHFVDCLTGLDRPAMSFELAAKHLGIIQAIC